MRKHFAAVILAMAMTLTLVPAALAAGSESEHAIQDRVRGAHTHAYETHDQTTIVLDTHIERPGTFKDPEHAIWDRVRGAHTHAYETHG